MEIQQRVKVQVVGVKRYDFTNDEKENVSGTTVYYLSESNDENIKGMVTARANLPYEAYKRFNEFPKEMNAVVTISMGNGNLRSKVVDFEEVDQKVKAG